jgi:SAM-dependent methyltransferase
MMSDAIKQNEQIYDQLWAQLPVPTHTDWPIWPELQKEIHDHSRLLEMGAGVLPRIPIEGGFFADLSQAALRKLDNHGGHGVRSAGPLPFCDGAFDVVCAFEVLEHIPDDETVLHELARVLRPGGALFFSVPVEPKLWTGFDDACGHVRRYVASELAARLAALGLHIERWTTQPNNFGKLSGDLAGAFLRATAGWQKLTLWLKKKAVEGEQRLVLKWRTDDIDLSHTDGGLIAIARKAG